MANLKQRWIKNKTGEYVPTRFLFDVMLLGGNWDSVFIGLMLWIGIFSAAFVSYEILL